MFSNSAKIHVFSTCLKLLRYSKTSSQSFIPIRFCETSLQNPVFQTRTAAVKPSNTVALSKREEIAAPVFRIERPKVINPEDVDILLEALKNCSDVHNVLELIEINVKDMNARHVAFCFRQLDNSNYGEEYTEFLLHSPEFHKLCNHALRKMQFFSPQEVLWVLQFMLYRRFDSDTPLMKAALQMIRRHINELSTMEIVILSALLRKIEKKHSICEALKASIPLLLEIKIDKKEVDFDNVKQLSYVLRTATFCNLKVRHLNHLLFALKDNYHDLGVKEAQIIYNALNFLDSRRRNVHKETLDLLLQHCNKLLEIEEKDEDDETND